MRARLLVAACAATMTLGAYAPLATARPARHPVPTATSSGSLPATPSFQVGVNLASGAQLAPGLFFIDPHQTVDSTVTGPEIINNQGQVIWYDPLPAGSSASNFQVQMYMGQPVLTWWQGTGDNPAFGAFAPGIGQGEDVIMNDHYQIIDVYSGDSSFTPDTHEFTITPQGDALISGYASVPDVNLTAVGGSANGTVIDSIAREVDIRSGKVLMNWSALAHVPITDSYALPLFGASPWDFFHINSISQGPGGSLLISARHMWALYDINPDTGAINWTLGGKQSSFAMGSGASFAWQHDPRFVAPDEIQLFDDEAGIPFAANETQSRALWVRLDYARHEATMVKQIVQPAGQAETSSQGSVQTLSDGNVVVGWGSSGTFSEYNSQGQLQLTDSLPPASSVGLITVNGQLIPNTWSTYRVFKFNWNGRPATQPVVSVQASSSSSWTVSAAWNGATDISRWMVLAGPRPDRLRPVATQPWDGLITQIPVSGDQISYVRLVALGRYGQVIGDSSTVAADS